jgi:Right handed beta helix region
MKLFSALLFVLFFKYSFANTYYISPKGSDANGSGTLSNPWQSLSKATATVTTGGDIIHVLPGVYMETARSYLAIGISIEGDGASSIITSTINQEFFAIIIAVSPQGTNGNQHISNIKLDGNNRTTSWAIEIRGRSNVSIHDCIITDFEDRGVLWTARNDNKDAAPEIFATGNTFYNNTVSNCAKYNEYGRGCLNIGGQEGMLIYNNNISQTGRGAGKNGWPIKSYNNGYLNGCKIYNNIITKQAFDGITWDFAIELFNESGLEIYGNTIQGAIDLNFQKKGGYPYSVWIHNNVINQPALNRHVEAGIILEFSTEAVIIENNRLKNIGTQVFFTPRQYLRKYWCC